jgi:hypothetical protein
MRLVRRRVEPELHGADDLAVDSGRQQHEITGDDAGLDLVEEGARFG